MYISILHIYIIANILYILLHKYSLSLSLSLLWASQLPLVIKNPSAIEGDARYMGLIPRLRRFPGEENGKPFQYTCLTSFMNRGD